LMTSLPTRVGSALLGDAGRHFAVAGKTGGKADIT
jgi:hypothetical protein